jgi:serine/threonine protein kinase
LIDARQFAEACAVWTTRKDVSLMDLLIERGWARAGDKAHIDYWVERKWPKQRDDVRSTLACLPADVKQSLAALEDSDIDRSLGERPHLERPQSAPTTDDTPTLPQRYTALGLRATGGIGRVWLARDHELGRDVALKELRPERADCPTLRARFLQEARVTGQLEHPGIVPVYELGRRPDNQQPFYTMRFLKGRTLSDAAAAYHARRRDGADDPLGLLNLLSAFVTVCNTVAYAHSRGVVHRDLKGQNVVLGDFGEVVVLDWGLAKRVGWPDGPPPALAFGAEPEVGEADLTLQGQMLGTPAFMAPEQAEGRLDLIDCRTDVYGLGAILHEILTGRPPFTGPDTHEVLRQVREDEVPRPRSYWPDVPPALEAICLTALAKKPADRYDSATKLADAVQGWQDVQRRQAEEDVRQARERLLRQQTALVALTRSDVFASPDLIATFRQMTEAAALTLGVERVSVWCYTEDRQAIRCEALYERSLERHTTGVELNAASYPAYFEALACSEVIAAEDAQRDPRTREFTETYLAPLGIGAMMDVPIHPGGVLCYEHVGPPRKWLPDEQLFAIAVAHLVAYAISQWQRRQVLEELHLVTRDTVETANRAAPS